MNFIKRNKNIIIALIIFFVSILFCIQLRNMLFPNEGAAVYGNRLDGKVELDKGYKEKVKQLAEGAAEVKTRISGRIINISIKVSSDVSEDAAKEYARKTLDAFTNEQKAYYDIQFFIEKEGDKAHFPIMGYKIQDAENITWTKAR